MAVSPVLFPMLETVSRPQIAIPFHAAFAAAGRVTLVSTKIPFPFRITRIGLACDALPPVPIQVSYYTSRNTQAPTTAPPPDSNVLAPFSPTPWFPAYPILFLIDMSFVPPADDTYVKVHFWNPNAGIFNIFCVVWIEAM